MVTTVEQLEEFMSIPSKTLIEDVKKLDGDFIILGIGGKMGPTLAYLLKNAIDEAGTNQRVIGVSRFSNDDLKIQLNSKGIETISCDLLNDSELRELPVVKNVIYMAGNKFGTAGNEHFTWAMNSYLPGRVAEHYKGSRMVIFSTGNVYPLSDVKLGGCDELVSPDPVGEYGQSCLGRERVFTYFSHRDKTPMSIFRLNYAIDLRYGVLLEVAKSVYNGEPVDVTMGHVNVIWQGSANEYAIRSLIHASTPPTIFNATGPEILSVKWVANEFAKYFEKEAIIIGEEAETALLSNATKAHRIFGYPSVSIRELIELIANWIQNDGELLNKPSHFQERKGQF
ncbi:NAD-dependent epimerase/dehydratase family protein [Ureibacillus acetophenoni]|uniref:Nucleoside-diphosphate-sugar epimerase n=1 Tax=Ureibacillus acetophenoni TaxID=614649 RepID=A0A285UGC1_9BACL|nr:NAD(P)-dependent oxidoreductase [Ureibacillus acetophenoni]SOC40955.1 nucleoside-diphosphate-sugar epimerase [Ureibacillus acetophenoni]